MYLITGMPRSGTSFMTKVFDYFGAVMKEPCACEYRYPRDKEMYCLTEPRGMAKACMEGMPYEHMEWVLDNIKQTNQKVKRDVTDILVMKTPQLVFFPDTLKLYEKVIICYRKPEDKWIQSMKNHGGIGWVNNQAVAFLRDKNAHTIKAVGEAWYKQSLKMVEELGDKAIAFELGNEESERACLGEFLHPPHVDQVLNEMLWNKRSRPVPVNI